MPSQDVRLSVRLSHAGIESKRLYISTKFFFTIWYPHHSSFPTPNRMAIFLAVASNARGYEKITIFDQYLALSRNWCKIEPYVRQIGNRTQAFKWYQFKWSSVTFSIGHDYSTSNKLKIVQHTAILTMAVYDLSNGAIFIFQWPWTTPIPPVSRSRNSLTPNISKTVRHTDIFAVSLKY